MKILQQVNDMIKLQEGNLPPLYEQLSEQYTMTSFSFGTAKLIIEKQNYIGLLRKARYHLKEGVSMLDVMKEAKRDVEEQVLKTRIPHSSDRFSLVTWEITTINMKTYLKFLLHLYEAYSEDKDTIIAAEFKSFTRKL